MVSKGHNYGLCRRCNKIHIIPTPPSREGIRLTREHKQRISNSLMGIKRKSFTDEHKLKLSLSHLGKKNPKESKTKKILFKLGILKPWNKGLTKETNESIRRISEKLRKPIIFNDKYRLTRQEWKDIREQVFELYGKICLDCNSNKDICVHHLIPYRISGSNELYLLIPLCKSCHRKWENIFRHELENKYFKDYSRLY